MSLVSGTENISSRYNRSRGPGSSVGIATGYGLDGPGIESRWGARFFAHVQTGPEAHPASYTMGTGSFPGVKRPGRGADHPPPSSAEVKKEYSYTSTHPLGQFRPATGRLYLFITGPSSSISLDTSQAKVFWGSSSCLPY
jgi:hypothetical protein